MRPAAGQLDGWAAAIGKRPIGGITITLERAGEVDGNDVIQARSSTTGFPPEKHVAARTAARPEITLLGLAVARRQIINRRFIHLHIAASQDSGADVFVNGFEPIGGQPHPARQGLPGQMNSVALKKNLFLPVQRQVVAVFADQNMRQHIQIFKSDGSILEIPEMILSFDASQHIFQRDGYYTRVDVYFDLKRITS